MAEATDWSSRQAPAAKTNAAQNYLKSLIKRDIFGSYQIGIRILHKTSIEGKITKQLLKTCTGEFDVESIHSLCLRDAGVNDLGCISECSCLERLDLSRNEITKLHCLAGLNQLTVLNLSTNRITSLEGLQSLENLHTLNLAGNLICSFLSNKLDVQVKQSQNMLGQLDSLVCLTGLDKLQELRLQDRISRQNNPVCQHVDYMGEMQKMFPNLLTLDGERLKGKGSEVYKLCQQIDTALCRAPGESAMQYDVSAVTPWVTSDFWLTSDSFLQSSLHDAEQQLTDLLTCCKRSAEQAEEKLFSNMSLSS